MKHHIVTAAILTHKDQYLCMQRGPSQYIYAAYKWEFPGGKVEQGESLPKALEREIFEEMRIKVKVSEADFFMTVNHQYPDFQITMHSFIIPVESRSFQLTEHVDYKWLDKEVLSALDWAEADLPIVAKLMG